MTEEPGFEVPPAAIINMIRQNLTERYRDPYAVVRELLQNSDDAKARRFEIGWSCGLGDVVNHPLLATPGIFIVNDGTFDASDSRAIRQINVSNKPGNADKIGQFGLGMKSVFHLCEAFAYAWRSHRAPQANQPSGVYEGAKILNPWGNLRHREWNHFDVADVAAVRNRIALLLPRPSGDLENIDGHDWFLLWLPLRRPEHGNPIDAGRDLITPVFYDNGPEKTRLFDDSVLRDLPTVLPLLRHIERLRIWRDDQNGCHLVFAAELKADSKRCTYRPGGWKGQRVLAGSIRLEHHAPAYATSWGFAGLEAICEDSELNAIKARSDWPTSETSDETGMSVTVATKAEAHGAVCFVRHRQDDGGPLIHKGLRIRWAVFLPLSEDHDEVVPNLGDDVPAFTMTLHGWFFVNSGRQWIDLASDSSKPPTIRQLWNQRMMEVVTLPLVIPAIKELADQLGLNHPDIRAVTGALSNSQLIGDHRKSICARSAWVLRLRDGSCLYEVSAVPCPIYLLPGDESSVAVAAATFRKLAGFCERHVVTFGDAPCLMADNSAAIWTVSTVVEMLDVDPNSILQDDQRLAYLTEFIESLPKSVEQSPEVQERLVAFIRNAVGSGVMAQQITDRRKDSFGRLVALLAPSRRIVLEIPEDFEEAVDNLLGLIARGRGKVVVLSKRVVSASSSFDDPCVSPDDAFELIGILGDAQSTRKKITSENGEDADDLASREGPLSRAAAWMIGRILLTCPPDEGADPLLLRIGDLPLFPTMIYRNDSRRSRRSIASLRASRDSGMLFAGIAGQAKNLGTAATCEVVVVDGDSGPRIFDDSLQARLFGGRPLPRCDVKSCFSVLRSGVKLADDLKKRLSLFDSILRESARALNPEAIACLRFLLHHQRGLFEQELSIGDPQRDLLLDVPSLEPAWRLLLGLTMAQRDESWRLLPSYAARELTEPRCEMLAIQPANRESIVSLISSLRENERRTLAVSDVAYRKHLLRTWPAEKGGLLRQLAIHTRSDDHLPVTIDAHTFMRRDYRLPPELARELPITLIEPYPEYQLWSDSHIPLVETFTAEQAIREVLALPQPSRHWRFLLETIRSLAISPMAHQTMDMLRTIAWLPTRTGNSARVVDVIQLPPLDAVLARCLPEDLSCTPWDRLSDELRAHENVEEIQQFLMTKLEAAEVACAALRRVPSMLIGEIDVDDRNRFDAWLDAFAEDRHIFPAAEIVAGLIEILDRDTARRLLVQYLAFDIPEPDLIGSALENLQRHHVSVAPDQRQPVIEIFNGYLALALRHARVVDVLLRKTALLTQQGKWRRSNELCIDSPGVSRASMLDAVQERILRDWIEHRRSTRRDVDSKSRSETTAGNLPRESDDDREHHFAATAAKMKRYFAGWGGRVSTTSIGGLFAFMGDNPAMRELATSCLQPHSVEKVRQRVRWKLPDVLRDGIWANRPERDGIEETMGRQRFYVEVVTQQSTQVPNIFAEPISVSLAQDYEHLVLYHDTKWIGVNNAIRVTTLQFRTVSAEDLRDSDRCKLLLGSTLRWMLDHLYRQRATDEEIDAVLDSDRDLGPLSVRIAQLRLLDALPIYLQQISYRGSGDVKEVMDAWNRGENARAEAELRSENMKGEDRLVVSDASARAAASLRKLRELMRQILLDDPVFQKQILESVREKMRVVQYTPDSIPFELFQNADDAVAEWGEMRSDALPLVASHRRFIITVDELAIRFFHWGRPINRARLGSFDGTPRRFDCDLIKMLIISGSDKSSEESRNRITGRFGYGFKSIYLYCSEPRVVSARLGFRVVAGFYPDELSDGESESMRQSAASLWHDQSEPGEPTVIELRRAPEDVGGPIGPILKRFHRLMPLLPVFAKQIRSVVLQLGNGQSKSTTWRPVRVGDLQRVHVGHVDLPLCTSPAAKEPASSSRALCLLVGPAAQPELCQMLFALADRGVAPIDSTIPSIWVTAPTGEPGTVGFVFNAPFELHIARASLNPQSEHNKDVVVEAGTHVGQALVELYDASQSDRADFCNSLGLNTNFDVYEFWVTLWERLGVSLEAGSGTAHSLLRELLWGDAGGMQCLIRERAAMPTGLPVTDPMEEASYRCLVAERDVRWVIRGVLARDADAFIAAAYWPRFKRAFPPGQVMHTKVDRVLQSLVSRGQQRSREDLWLTDALKEELGGDCAADSECASAIGELIKREFLVSLEREAEHRREYERLTELLHAVQFKCMDGTWTTTTRLVVSHDTAAAAEEDRLRASFAPRSHILDPSYKGDGIEFFYACRGGQRLKPDEIAAWMIRPEINSDQRRAVVQYLIKSRDAERVGEAVRDLPRSWLNELKRTSKIFEGFSPEEIARVLQRVGANEWSDFVQGVSTEPHVDVPPPLPDNAVHLIAAWWQKERQDRLKKYYNNVYPDGVLPNLCMAQVRDNPPVLEEPSSECRRGWMMLFMVGAMQTMGRTRPSQHSGFMRRCLEQGWLNTFATPPVTDSTAWVGLLRDYFDPQLDDQEYLQWMSLYPRFFQFSHWLHQYVWWFKIVGHRKNFGLSDILSPNASSYADRTEIQAPPLTRSLGYGFCFVIRELVKAEFFERPEPWRRFCYCPAGRVRTLLARLRVCDLPEDAISGYDRIKQSEIIHQSLCNRLGAEGACFGGDFDIPLLALADDEDLLARVLAT